MEPKSDRVNPGGACQEMCFIVSGLTGQKFAGIEGIIEECVETALRKQKVSATISAFAHFSGVAVGLRGFKTDEKLGFVRITDVETIDEMRLQNEIKQFKLHSIPGDVFGASHVMLQGDLYCIPDVGETLNHLCKALGVRIDLSSSDIWLIGNILPLSVARCHLNRLYNKYSETEFLHNYSSNAQITLVDASPYHQFLTEDVYDTGYLLLYLLEANISSGVQVLVAFTDDLSQSKLLALETIPKKNFWKNIPESIKSLTEKFKPLYITDKIQSDNRCMLEECVQKAYKPVVFLKCARKHWSCFVISQRDHREAQKFVDRYIRVNRCKEEDIRWSELPNHIKSCVDPQFLVTKSNPDSQYCTQEIVQKGHQRPEKSMESRLMEQVDESAKTKIAPGGKATEGVIDDAATKVEGSETPTGDKLKYSTISHAGKKVKFEAIQHLWPKKDLQELLKVNSARLILQSKSPVLVGAANEEIVNHVKSEIFEMLENLNIQRRKVLGSTIPHCSEVGHMILDCRGDTVYAIGPQDLIKAFDSDTQDGGANIERTTDERSELHSKDTAQVSEHMDNKPLDFVEKPGQASKRYRGLKKEETKQKTKPDKPLSKPPPLEELASFKSRQGGTTVYVGKGDITRLQVDAIVNAANRELDHIGGVARAISEAAGPELDEESKRIVDQMGEIKTGKVCITSGGKLPAKKVLHAVGPAKDKYKNEQDAFAMLEKTFEEILETAKEQQIKSIAIPAISSGAFGIPEEAVAEKACSSLSGFLDKGNTGSLQTIIFIDIRPHMIQCFNSEMERLVTEGVLSRSG